MSDVRVKIDAENDHAKRRPGAGDFGSLLASGSGGAVRGQYALMADFLDEAFEDHKLDDNELAGMKVLAGMTPGCKPPMSPPPSCLAPDKTPQPATPPRGDEPKPPVDAKPPCVEPAPANPPVCAPAEPEKPYDFKAEVARELDKSKDWDTGEQMVLDMANRLMCATREQQMAFTRQLCKVMSDNDVDESGGSEGTTLDAFVNGLLAINPQGTAHGGTAGRANGSPNDCVRDYLRQVLCDDRVSAGELSSLRSLLNGPAAEPHRQPPPAASTRQDGLVFDPSMTLDARHSSFLNELLQAGGISYETAQRARASLSRDYYTPGS